MKKLVISTLIAASAFAPTEFAQAASTTTGQSSYENLVNSLKSGVQSGFQSLQEDIDKKYDASATWVYKGTFPDDTNDTNNPSITNTPYLNKLQLANSAQTGALITDLIDSNTQANTDNTLTQFMYDLYTNDYDSQQNIKAKIVTTQNLTSTSTNESSPKITEENFSRYRDDNSPNNLINGENYASSSTLYISNTSLAGLLKGQYKGATTTDLFSKPTTMHNNYLNFSSLISPTAYTQDQVDAAKKYVVFAAQSTKNLASDLDLSKIITEAQNKIAGSTDKTKKLALAFSKIKNDPAFLKYMMLVKSLVAIRSVSLNNLEYLIAERTPSTKLGPAAGKPNGSASPLEVEAYRATHRVTDPNWYHSIKIASPATIQRTTLIILAEIERQNYQAHLDRERILAALTAANLSTNLSGSDILLKQAAMDANKAISSALNPGQATGGEGGAEESGTKLTGSLKQN